jgi:hypothetical protein
MSQDYSKLEEKLRSLPTVRPPAALRAQILGQTRARSAKRRSRKMNLNFALVATLFLLLAFNIMLNHIQSVRIERVVGNNHTPYFSTVALKNMTLTLAEQRTLMQSFLTVENAK